MSKQMLPEGHPFADAGERKDFWNLAAEAIRFRRAEFGGFNMELEDEDDEDEDDDEGLDPNAVVKVGDRTFKVSELQTIMAREKRQGKRSGQRELLTSLGYESADDLKAALEAARPAGDGKKSEADEAAARAAVEREEAARKREATAAAKERKAELRGALREHGVDREDLDDVYAMLNSKVPADYDEDDLEEAVEALKKRRPALFGEEKDGDEGDEKKPKTPRAPMPVGGQRRKTQTTKTFGSAGLERARRKGWVKD